MIVLYYFLHCRGEGLGMSCLRVPHWRNFCRSLRPLGLKFLLNDVLVCRWGIEEEDYGFVCLPIDAQMWPWDVGVLGGPGVGRTYGGREAGCDVSSTGLVFMKCSNIIVSQYLDQQENR
jgi:hypothetical protein